MNKTKTIVGIAGASGAGKSFLAKQLLERLQSKYDPNQIAILNEDAYYHRQSHLSFEERMVVNYDHPDAIEHDLLVQHLRALRKGETVQVPQYDYAKHDRKPEAISMSPPEILILEGILVFDSVQVRDELDLKVFVDVDLDICLLRRLRRDIELRGRSLDSVLNQYESTVRPMFFQFVEPTKSHADIIVPRGGDNVNALNVLESHLASILCQDVVEM